MPQAELAEWSLYAQLEPFGSHYDDLRCGQIIASEYELHRDATKRPKAFTALEFIPWNDSVIAEKELEAKQSVDPGFQLNAQKSLFKSVGQPAEK